LYQAAIKASTDKTAENTDKPCAFLGNTTNDAGIYSVILEKGGKLKLANSFIKGMGVGLVAGTAIAMMISPPDKKKMMHSRAGRAIKVVGDIVESITDVMS
jgi:hypothetical protein